MVLVKEVVHPKGLDASNSAKVVVLRDAKKLTWPAIAGKVLNRAGGHPSTESVRRAYSATKKPKVRKYHYNKCGRKPWKVTGEIKSFILRRLLALRKEVVCTSETLAREVAREYNTKLESSTVRKVLKAYGYKWLRRTQKTKYSPKVRKECPAFRLLRLYVEQRLVFIFWKSTHVWLGEE